MNHAFIGYDPREHDAYNVCKSSIERRGETKVIQLNDRVLRRIGLYDRPYHVTGSGQYLDTNDGRPFSTMFSFTRFLVPAYARWLGIKDKWVLFADCDIIFLRPLEELFDLADDRFALMCVKHNHTDAGGKPKMDGVVQTDYNCKNWSSLMLWNLHHEATAKLRDQDPNQAAGAWLHAFRWISDRGQIGALPEEWNWLNEISPTTSGGMQRPKAIHYTEGGPWFEGFENCRNSRLWNHERNIMLATQRLGTGG